MPCLRAIRSASTSVANPEVSMYETSDKSTDKLTGFARKASDSVLRISPEVAMVTRPWMATLSPTSASLRFTGLR